MPPGLMLRLRSGLKAPSKPALRQAQGERSFSANAGADGGWDAHEKQNLGVTRTPSPQPSPARGRGGRALLPLPRAGEGAGHCAPSCARERAGGEVGLSRRTRRAHRTASACKPMRALQVRALDQQSPSVSPQTPGTDRGPGCFPGVTGGPFVALAGEGVSAPVRRPRSSTAHRPGPCRCARGAAGRGRRSTAGPHRGGLSAQPRLRECLLPLRLLRFDDCEVHAPKR